MSQNKKKYIFFAWTLAVVMLTIWFCRQPAKIATPYVPSSHVVILALPEELELVWDGERVRSFDVLYRNRGESVSYSDNGDLLIFGEPLETADGDEIELTPYTISRVDSRSSRIGCSFDFVSVLENGTSRRVPSSLKDVNATETNKGQGRQPFILWSE